ncbi:unnamed protein product [Didymodactylos carnosus]|uniref:Golgin subfamily A conserved domain-containing protein n=1 Tax=Didymodactylos carnosus TaxID=1234261 RepID=A0A8S2J451_9BILA|nr:unnamed protein product [Didymodactylos carnosus]CAF3786439.1 unnamed protein product [Didymodactylos carnosus]
MTQSFKMVDEDKRENLANARKKQQAILNGIDSSLSKSPVDELESGRSSQTQQDVEVLRGQIEQKYRRDLDHFKEQLEIHIQTIGILVAEKTDIQAKLTQSFKQLERKQNELDELQGRLKASRERVQELEKTVQNSTSNVQKREMAAKEYEKENDRLKLENIRQNQTIEDLKQKSDELNDKLNTKLQSTEQLNDEILQLKRKLEQSEIRSQQFQSINDTTVTDRYEQQIEELKHTIQLKTNEADALQSTANQLRTDKEQMQVQYQQYSNSLQRQTQELTDQLDQLTRSKNISDNEHETMKQSYEMKIHELQTSQAQIVETSDSDYHKQLEILTTENDQLKMTVNEWMQRYESTRIDSDQIYKLLSERDERIAELELNMVKTSENVVDHEKLLETMQSDKMALSRAMAQNKQLKEQFQELQEGFIKLSNDNMNLTNRIQAEEYLSKQLGDRIGQKEIELYETRLLLNEHENQHQIATHASSNVTTSSLPSSNEKENQLTQQITSLLEENNSLHKRLSYYEQQQQQSAHSLGEEHLNIDDTHLNDTASLSSMGSHIEDIERGDEQQQHVFVQKIIDRFNRAMRENADLQDRTQQLEHLILQLQNETDTIGDYIYLYQQQRQQLHRRYQQKDDYIKQMTQDRFNLQKKLSELEKLLLRALNSSETKIQHNIETKPVKEQHSVNENSMLSQSPPLITTGTDANDWPELVDNALPPSEIDNSTSILIDKTQQLITTSPSLSDFDNETKTRIFTLLKELGEVTPSLANDSKNLAFIDKNLYICSACVGPVQWV